MKDVVGINIFNVFARHHIDLVVPLFVERAKLPDLILLLFRQIRKILGYERGVLQSVLILKLLQYLIDALIAWSCQTPVKQN